MRAQSLWANIQGFPYPVFHLQGILPSDLFKKYNEPGGNWALELDLLVANEIADQLNDSASSVQKKRRRNAKGAVARRDQRRQTYSPAETVKQLNALIDNKGVKKDG